MTNMGLFINLPLWHGPDTPEADFVLAALRCWEQVGGASQRIRIYLRRVRRELSADSVRPIYRREHCNKFELAGPLYDLGTRQGIYVLEEEQFDHIELIDSFHA